MAYADMGIPDDPITLEQLRALMAEADIKPGDNIFSREIVAMRDK